MALILVNFFQTEKKFNFSNRSIPETKSKTQQKIFFIQLLIFIRNKRKGIKSDESTVINYVSKHMASLKTKQKKTDKNKSKVRIFQSIEFFKNFFVFFPYVIFENQNVLCYFQIHKRFVSILPIKTKQKTNNIYHNSEQYETGILWIPKINDQLMMMMIKAMCLCVFNTKKN